MYQQKSKTQALISLCLEKEASKSINQKINVNTLLAETFQICLPKIWEKKKLVFCSVLGTTIMNRTNFTNQTDIFMEVMVPHSKTPKTMVAYQNMALANQKTIKLSLTC